MDHAHLTDDEFVQNNMVATDANMRKKIVQTSEIIVLNKSQIVYQKVRDKICDINLHEFFL